MTKLTLDLEHLPVESFATAATLPGLRSPLELITPASAPANSCDGTCGNCTTY